MRTSIHYYRAAGEGFPPRQSQGKFLQLAWQGEASLVFAAEEICRFHNQILARFVAANAIPHRWAGAAELVFCHPRLQVLGGGRFRLDLDRHALEVWDESSVYGRFRELDLARLIQAAGPPWHDLLVRIADGIGVGAPASASGE